MLPFCERCRALRHPAPGARGACSRESSRSLSAPGSPVPRRRGAEQLRNAHQRWSLGGAQGGEPLEVEEEHGTIRIARPKRRVRLIETEHGVLTAGFDPPLAATTPEEVRDALERTRR